jgi:hypothetical protein
MIGGMGDPHSTDFTMYDGERGRKMKRELEKGILLKQSLLQLSVKTTFFR